MPVIIIPHEPTVPEPIPQPPPDPIPEPDTPYVLGAPTGTIPKGKIGGGGPWSLVNVHDPSFVKWGTTYSVEPEMLKSMMIVETGGKNVSDPFGASGVMQIKKQYWGTAATKAGFNLDTDDGQVGMAGDRSHQR